MEKSGFQQFHICHCTDVLLRVLSCIETLISHVMCLKGLIAARFGSSEPLHLLRVNRRVGAISLPTL